MQALTPLRVLLLLTLLLFAGCTSPGMLATSGQTMSFTPIPLIRTANRSPDELARMRDFADGLKDAINSADLSATGVSNVTITVNSTGRWMAVQFTFRGSPYAFAGGLVSADVLIRTTQVLQFQPQIATTEGFTGGVTLDPDQAREPWNALKAALEIIARKAAENVGLAV